ncbi:MAG TPA: lanthionine synthetase LanC family protein [Acidimicrobiales bacterium]|nr:lanthionine synthetase LanC family protein [Acidimicrobiales bacterium]
MSADNPDLVAVVDRALDWLVASARVTEHGVAWADTQSADDLNPNLYNGGAGIVMTLLEAYRHFDDDRFGDLALATSRDLGVMLDTWEHCSLYFGLTGMAVALQAVHEVLGDSLARANALKALHLVRARFDGERWSDQFELLGGNAGIGLGALRVGDTDLAVMAVTPYIQRAEKTKAGINWEVREGTPARFHHISHGTLGIVEALAAVGAAAKNPDLIDLALAGASDVVSRNESEDGFLVPHSDPQHRPELIDRHSYGWCHGPAGDAQVFRLLAAVTGDDKWMELTDRCWRTLLESGVPERVRPGFWDNSGRCCGTAGVLALACDRYVERDQDLAFARVLVHDVCRRATLDGEGARWSNFEHRVTPSELEPRTGWAMGNAGIIRELLRFARIVDGRSSDYFVLWPDQPATGPRTL